MSQDKQSDVDPAMSQWFEAERPERKPKAHLEDNMQTDFFTWARINAKKYPGLDLMYMNANGSFLAGTPKQRMISGARAKRMGLKPGIPDTFLPVPRQNYHGLYIEFKSEKGIISPEQTEIGTRLMQQGYSWQICRGWEAAAECIRAYYAEI